jgi:cytochrome b pre-mRNA-processing protein 3
MSILSRLLRPRGDEYAAVRPLWHRAVEIAREKAWYAQGGVADTVPGRFDIVTLVLSLVLLRMEHDPALITPSVRLTELFVTDMDGQLRQSGVGDLMVGKRMGKLMSVLGGRLGAFREALAQPDDGDLIAAITRNVTLLPGTDPATVARFARSLAGQLDAIPGEALLAGDIPR